MSHVKISSGLPPAQKNGLDEIARQLVDHPEVPHLVIGYLRTVTTTIHHSTGAARPTVEFAHLEVVRPVDLPIAIAMVEAAFSARTALQPLPGLE